MSVVHNIFCPQCDSILDISKTTTKKVIDLDESQSSVSDEGEEQIVKIINKILTDDDVDKLISNIKVENIVNHESYKKLDKNKKHKINEKIENIASKTIDSTLLSYYSCKSCGWSQKIKHGTQILTKTGGDSQSSYINIERYRNKIYSKILPFTRNYICPNKNCPGNKDKEKHEAVMYRINDTMRTMYTCCACKTVFGAQ